MNKCHLKAALLGIAYLSFMMSQTANAGTCRTVSASSPVHTITYPIGTSNVHIAERMRSGHVYPTRLQVLRQMAAKTGRRVNPANPVAGFLNYTVTCRIVGRTYSRSIRRVSYRYKCTASGRVCSVNARGPIRGRRGQGWRP